ncbi:MAG: protein kinase [Tannerella sp.]|jgi:serine/threonine protein kinase|nr:protein kinase [Tannerella sp.]
MTQTESARRMDNNAQKCDFCIDEIIDNQYCVEKILGQGAFGKVFKVKDCAGMVYALKLMKLWEMQQDIRKQIIARFDMEYETGRINSHYLVRTVNHGLVKGNPYIVMEYFPNGDLKQWMNHTKLDLIKIGKEILYGFKDLHSCGKVHRDLKPANVLIRDDGSAALTDFGIAGDRNKRMTERNIMGVPQQIIGTYPYMPPEQVQPKEDATVLPTTDIFAFGVMMYELITGQLPFGRLESLSDLETYKRNGSEERWDRTKLAESVIGSSFSSVIEGCLKPNYKKRLQSVDEVLKLMPHSAGDVPYKSYMHPVQMVAKNGILLRIMQGEEYGKIYQLNSMLRDGRRLITVGRHDAGVQNTLIIVESRSSYISRKHCTLEIGDLVAGQWYIRDGQWTGKSMGANNWKQSKNGTFVNSSEASCGGLPIMPGDIVSIGDVKLRVEGY